MRKASFWRCKEREGTGPWRVRVEEERSFQVEVSQLWLAMGPQNVKRKQPERSTRAKFQGQVFHIGAKELASDGGTGAMPQNDMKVLIELSNPGVRDTKTLIFEGRIDKGTWHLVLDMGVVETSFEEDRSHDVGTLISGESCDRQGQGELYRFHNSGSEAIPRIILGARQQCRPKVVKPPVDLCHNHEIKVKDVVVAKYCTKCKCFTKGKSMHSTAEHKSGKKDAEGDRGKQEAKEAPAKSSPTSSLAVGE
jgi:hypothetical protein